MDQDLIDRIATAIREKSTNPEVAPIAAALGVILLDHRSRAWLEFNDPMAFRQALNALGVAV